MRKVLAALAAGVAAVIGVFFARAEGLVTAQAVSDVLFGLWYSSLALVGSWLLTASVGSRHKAMAMGSAAGLLLIGGVVRWGLIPPVSWLAVCFIVSVASPLAFAASEAALAQFGIRLRKNKETGAVEGIKVDNDETIWIGSPTSDDVKREGIKPEPSNE
jgi:hypothetical protein